ncbi:MAG TPA: chromosome segregation protein SMC, partial [Savagea sp.]
VEQLQTKYGIYGRIEQCPEIESIDDARERLAKMKEERKQIGPVDPSTIEQYEEVLERHTFLSEQRTDLIEAKITLQDAMEEMDEEVEQRFIVTFRAIRHHFQDIFTKMFGGGEADLKLTDPNNLLETGVDIVARPPGKKLQNLSLLSGGERALTAITLLFALIEARPVPFCILDEVEAALDEVNVLRYSDYLKHFSTSTQFIVITHRKGTMEGADVLYGVTMEEAGVSTMLSVQLSEVEEKIGLT